MMFDDFWRRLPAKVFMVLALSSLAACAGSWDGVKVSKHDHLKTNDITKTRVVDRGSVANSKLIRPPHSARAGIESGNADGASGSDKAGRLQFYQLADASADKQWSVSAARPIHSQLAQDTGKKPVAEEVMSLEKAAQKANNPVSDVWLLIVQNDLTVVDTSDGDKVQNVTTLQPVMPVPILDGEWNLVNRIVTGIVTAPLDDDPNSTDPFGSRTTGNTDTVFFTLAAPNRDDGWIWGVGPTFVLPTATEDVLGQGKWQAGPAGLLVRLGNDSGGFGIEHFNMGMLAQHWWSFAGDDDRANTTGTNIQYFINWKKDKFALIGMTPNIIIDWEKEGSDRFTVPIGLGYIGLTRWGKLPIRWGIEAQYFVNQPDSFGPRFNLKLFLAPIISNPFK